MKWARAIARGVRRRYGFLRGSQEERELEAEAYEAISRYAPRFSAVRSFRRGAARAITAACRRFSPSDRAPSVDRHKPIDFAGTDQRRWVYSIVRPWRAGLSRGAHRRLLAVALAIAAGRAERFDPVGAFRGWAAVEVRSRCQREAVRLRNGGTFYTAEKADELPFQVHGLPQSRRGNCSEAVHAFLCAAIGEVARDEPELPRQLHARPEAPADLDGEPDAFLEALVVAAGQR